MMTRVFRPAAKGCLIIMFFLTAVVLETRAQFSYSTNNGTITITGYNGAGGSVSIPDNIDAVPVTQIATRAFSNASSITSIFVPNSVMSIGPSAFANCTSLTAVTLSQSIKTIEYGAFSACGALRSIDLPNSVTNIGDYAFTFCGLTNVQIPKGLFSIGNVAFANCSKLTRVTIPESVVSIGVYSFSACTALTGAYFEGDRPFIGTDAFVNDNVTIYYPADAKGWDSIVAGKPALVWNPVIVTNDSNFGISGDQFGFTITGSRGVVVVVEGAPSLSTPVWTSLQTNTLNGDPLYFQTARFLDANRFFRLRAP